MLNYHSPKLKSIQYRWSQTNNLQLQAHSSNESTNLTTEAGILVLIHRKVKITRTFFPFFPFPQSKTYDSVNDKFMELNFEKTNSAYMLFYEWVGREAGEQRGGRGSTKLEGKL